jgi:hypothetical protein
MIDAYCRRDFELHEKVDIAISARHNEDRYLLPVYPLIKINSLEINGESVSIDGIFSDPCGLVKLQFYVAKDVWLDFNVDHGYAEPPAAVKEATLRLASRLVRHQGVRERVAEGMTDETIADYSATFGDLDIDRDIAILLKMYVRRR